MPASGRNPATRLGSRRPAAEQNRASGATPVGSARSAAARMVVGTFAAQAFLLGSGILAARLLGPEDRGYLALLVLAPIVLGTIGGLGVPQAVTYWSARNSIDGPAILRIAAPAYLAQVVVLTLVNVLLVAAFGRTAAPNVAVAAVILLVATPAVLTWQYAVAIVQGRQRFGHATLILLVAPGTYVAGLTALAVLGRGRLETIAAVWTMSYVFAAVLGLVLVRRGTVASPGTAPKVSLRAMLGFGLRALPSLASPLQTLRLDQAAVGILLGAAFLGHYVVALAFTNLPILLAVFMSVTISGRVAAQPDVRLASRSLAGMVATLATVAVAIAAVLAVIAPGLISVFFGPAFAAATTPARILLVGAVAAGLQRAIGDGLRAMGDPVAGTVAEMGSWVVLVPGLIVLPGAWGVEGVAIAVAASYCAGLAIVGLRWLRRSRRGVTVLDGLAADAGAGATEAKRVDAISPIAVLGRG